MKIKDQLVPIVDDVSVLDNISLNYRFMHVDKANYIREIYTGIRFSESKKHRASLYINYSCYKPISNLFMKQILKINERNRVL